MNLIDRANGTQTTIDNFAHTEFAWGSRDCGQLAGQHLEILGFETALKAAGNYKTERGAKIALGRLGFPDMEAVVDALGFERIAPAMAITGDIVGFPGGSEEKPWTALGIHVGGDRVMGYADVLGEGPTCEFGPVSVCTVAWRVG
jgi:hypothetical protein